MRRCLCGLVRVIAGATCALALVAPTWSQARSTAQKPGSAKAVVKDLGSLKPLAGTRWDDVEENPVVAGTRYDIGYCVEFGPRYYEEVGYEEVVYDCTGYEWFDALVGVLHKSDSNAEITFEVLLNGEVVNTVGPLTRKDKAVRVTVPIRRGTTGLTLRQRNRGSSVYAAWLDAKLYKGGKPPNLGSTGTSGGSSGSSDGDVDGGSTSEEGDLLSFDTRDIADLASKLQEQVLADRESFPSGRVQLAVASFELIPSTLSSANARKLREHLSTALIKLKAFRLVERAQLDKVLAEQKKGLGDLFDSATVQKIGKLVGAEAVLIGSISDESSFVTINVRLLSTRSGEATIAESVEVKKR